MDLFLSQIENPSFGLADFIESCCLSSSQLNRIFLQYLNTSASLFIGYLRLSYVLHHLAETNRSMIDLVYSVNLYDIPYFYKCFKKVYNSTPRLYLKHNLYESNRHLYARISVMLKNDKVMRI